MKMLVNTDGSGHMLDGSPAELDEFIRRQLGTYGTAPRWVGPQTHAPECAVAKAAFGWWSITPPTCTCNGRVTVKVIKGDGTAAETIK